MQLLNLEIDSTNPLLRPLDTPPGADENLQTAISDFNVGLSAIMGQAAAIQAQYARLKAEAADSDPARTLPESRRLKEEAILTAQALRANIGQRLELVEQIRAAYSAEHQRRLDALEKRKSEIAAIFAANKLGVRFLQGVTLDSIGQEVAAAKEADPASMTWPSWPDADALSKALARAISEAVVS